jgi:hypothetical protein
MRDYEPIEKEETQTSDSIHNYNCYLYLKEVTTSDLSFLNPNNPTLAEKLRKAQSSDFNPQMHYGDLYTELFDYIDENIDELYQGWFDLSGKKNPLDAFVISLYNNNSLILEKTYDAIKEQTLAQRPTSNRLEKTIKHQVSDSTDTDKKNINALSPAQMGSRYGRFKATFLDRHFKPQHTTSLVSVRHYTYSTSRSMQELRMGTQAQRHDGAPRISPLFKHFLAAQQRANPDSKKPITHVYFNNLGRDRTDSEGKVEKALTGELEALDKKDSTIAVITLPADKGLMDGHDYQKLEPKLKYEDVHQEFLNIALESENATTKVKVKDFHISGRMRELLFEHKDKEILTILINKSFKAMGVDSSASLSKAQRQAVWFHFIKFELPNDILEKLEPKTFNFTCKDGIDRGGVSSAYYNLMKSLETQTPMNREEFECALHAAPTMVKGRGLNHHAEVIWNAVDQYIRHNQAELSNDSKKAWLIAWRDVNCPHHRVNDLLIRRLTECTNELNAALNATPALDDRQKKLIADGIEMLKHIKSQSSRDPQSNRLLLDAALCSAELILHPENLASKQVHYEAMTQQLAIKYPKLQAIVDFLKILLD